MFHASRVLALSFVFLPAVSHPQSGNVAYERLLRDEADSENWLTYSGGYSSQRYSRLDQIRTSNVARLRVEWVHQVETMQILETNPIVADGIMYITEPPSDVVALDVRTGRPFWSYRHKLSTSASADKIVVVPTIAACPCSTAASISARSTLDSRLSTREMGAFYGTWRSRIPRAGTASRARRSLSKTRS